MKKFKMFAIALVAVMACVINVNAEELIKTAEGLSTCLASEEAVCKLGSDIVLDINGEVTGKITLDLNGYSITPSETFVANSDAKNKGVLIVHNGASLTVNDSVGTGKISVAETGVYAGIVMTKTGDDATKIATLVVNAGTIEGYYYGISGNGSRPNTSITINAGTIKGTNPGYQMGIFHPQEGTITVNGGTISGMTGIEMRAGTLKVTGGTIIGDYEELTVNANGSGSTTTGAAIAIAQHNTLKAINVTISGGTVKGYAALSEADPQENGAEGQKLVTINITGGTFEAMNGSTAAIVSANKTGFISGGTYSSDVTKYIATGLVSKKLGDVYVVATENKVNVTEVTNGTVTVDKTKAIVGEEVTITLTSNEGYELATLKVVDADNKEITVTDGKFTMPNSAVTVTAEFVEIKHEAEITPVDTTEEVEEVTVGVTNSETTEEVLLDSLNEAIKNDEALSEVLANTSAIVSVEINALEEKDIEEEIKDIEKEAGKVTIATYFDIAVLIKDNDEEIGSLTKLTKEIELAVLLPENLKNTDKEVTRKYYLIRRHVNEDGKVEVEKLDATLSKDGKSLTFKTDKFSTYALAYEDVANEVTESPKTLDNAELYIILGSISLVALSAIAIYRRKRYN